MNGIEFEVGDVWRDAMYTRTILAVYDRDVLVVCEWAGSDRPVPRQTLVLPKRLFAEHRCGEPVETVAL